MKSYADWHNQFWQELADEEPTSPVFVVKKQKDKLEQIIKQITEVLIEYNKSEAPDEGFYKIDEIIWGAFDDE